MAELRECVSIRSEILGDDAIDTTDSRFVLAWPLAENGFAIDDREALAEAEGLLPERTRPPSDRRLRSAQECELGDRAGREWA